LNYKTWDNTLTIVKEKGHIIKNICHRNICWIWNNFCFKTFRIFGTTILLI